MNNFTMNTYEMKREIVNFSKKVCVNCDKPTSKFVTGRSVLIGTFMKC